MIKPTCSGTFDVQHHAWEGEVGDEASHLGRPRLDGLPALRPQNHLGRWLDVAHDLEAHVRGQLQRGRERGESAETQMIGRQVFRRRRCLKAIEGLTLFLMKPSW